MMKLSSLLEPALDDLLARLKPLLAVVRAGRRGAGAGVLAGDGLVLTNHHVVGKGRGIEVELADGQVFKASLVADDPQVDLALLRISGGNGHAAVFSTAEPRPGEMVYAFGHPWGQRYVLTGGVLSAHTSGRTPAGEIPLLRADLQLAPGNSGGPLLNAAGEVIGLNAMIFGGDQSVAIPSTLIRSFLEQARQSMPQLRHKEEVF